MFTPFTSRHFTSYIDPVSGAKIAVLSTHLSAVQQALYFVNSGYSGDGRYLWFLCANPPAAGHHTAVIDFLTDEVHSFPETAGSGYMVDPRTGNLYWCCHQGLFTRTPHPSDKPQLIARLPECCRKLGWSGDIAHLTFSPDYREIMADFQTPKGCTLGTFSVASGEYTQWYETEPDRCYDHAQFSPTDPNMMMCAHEMWNDLQMRTIPVYENGIYPRIQFITRDGKRRIIRLAGNMGGHEFWAPDGESVYYVNNDFEDKGYGIVARGPVDGSEPEIILKVTIEGSCNHTWHAHCSRDENLFVVDGSVPSMGLPVWRGCASTLHFFNKKTQKMIRFLTCNPVVEDWTPEYPCSYHIDPHPRFVMNDTQITFTTTVMGRVDLAVVDVQQLADATC